MTKNSKLARWMAILSTLLTIVAFLPGGIMKTSLHPMVVEGFARIGIPAWAIVPLGLIELFCLALFLFPRTAFLGTLLLSGYLGGAMLANLISEGDLVHVVVVGIVVWTSAWLRVPAFRAGLSSVMGRPAPVSPGAASRNTATMIESSARTN